MENSKVINSLSDDNILLSKDDNFIELKTQILDELEYECFELFKKYAVAFNIEIIDTDDDKIDFYTAKTIQDTIIKIFEDTGFKISVE